MNKLLKALETFALAYNEGKCSVDSLIKACSNYKNKIGFVEDLDYDIKVSKSCFDYINGVEQDKEIAKAIVPGQTKVIDGVLYVYSATKTGSKTEYNWHVVRKGTKAKQAVGRSGKLTDAQIKGKQKYVNDLFPNDLSKLKVVKTLGGSTGAQLVEDSDGNQYVLKKGTNTNSGHVKSEYLTNQLYNVMGLRTPDYELYEDNGETILLSRFIQGTHAPMGSSDYAKLAEGFMADILLANWDVYQNDNCLIKNANGTVYRVDNGGSLDYRAQGKKKNFDWNVFDTWKSMSKYNPGISKLLTADEQLKQIEEISKKKDDVVNFLIESGEDNLAQIMSSRFDDLKRVKNELQRIKDEAAIKAAAKLGKVPPRKLKPAKEMYAEFSDKKIKDILDATAQQVGTTSDNDMVLFSKSASGWALLSNICKERGFDARPEVVSDTDFWKKKDDSEWPLMLRGFDNVKYKDDFQLSDFCHFGNYGIWAQGIYAHSDDKSRGTNDNTKHSKAFVDNNSNSSNYKKSPIYSGSESAVGYAGGNEDAVAKFCWAKDANVINSEDLLDEIKAIGSSRANSKKAKELKKQLDDIKAEWTKNELDLLNVGDIVKKAVYDEIGYDEDAVANLYDYLDNIDWGSRNAQGKRNYPMFDDAVVKHIVPCIKACGGEAEILNQGEEDEQMHATIGDAEIYISKYSWNNNAVKQKNQFTAPYHYQAQKFTTFFDTNCVKPASDAVQKELDSCKKSAELKAKVAKSKQDYYNKEKEYNDEINIAGSASGNDIYSRIYNKVKSYGYRSSGGDKSLLGIYAALKGYDGIYQPDGNGSGHGFVIILNRSKIVTSL